MQKDATQKPPSAIFRDGLRARCDAQALSANPYEPESVEAILWEEGWCSPDEIADDSPTMSGEPNKEQS